MSYCVVSSEVTQDAKTSETRAERDRTSREV